MDRRFLLRSTLFGAATASGAGALHFGRLADNPGEGPNPPAFGIVPVVGDGKWIWTKAPKEKGYLEPRTYELKVGMQLRGTGPATGIKATTVAPVQLPEQTIDSVSVHTDSCRARLRQLTPEAGQLLLRANSLRAGQVIGAYAHYRITVRKDFRGFARDQFPYRQEFPKAFRKRYLYDSPGIQTRFKLVKETAAKVAANHAHPWDQAKAFHSWVWENIRGRIQNYSSVVRALKDRVGDCEERAAVFVAFCRASGIPARLVWVPNHNWAEFLLRDHEGKGHWIPCHTSCYSWFGWTGAHELVLQKGDSIRAPEKRRPYRLLADWMQGMGKLPQVRYFAELTPLPPQPGVDPGPGGRSKDAQGKWLVTHRHPLDHYLRGGAKSDQKPPRKLSG